jgi:hypothetical protein
MSEAIDWLRPAPLWDLDGRDFTDFFAPTLLEFKSDDFMDEFFAAAGAPGGAGLRGAVMGRPEDGALKLFQPVHGCFYLVCSSLCCRVPGFPDRAIRRANDERVSFVLRKLAQGVEYAWAGPGDERSWQPVPGAGRALLADEERLPMAEASAACGRKLHFGYLPVASGESYKRPAPAPTDADAADFPDTRIEELGARFTRPLTGDLDELNNPIGRTMAIREVSATQARTASIYLLLEAYDWLAEPAHLPDVAALLAGTAGATLSEPRLAEQQALIDHLNAAMIAPGLSLGAAIGAVGAARDTLNQAGGVEGDAALAALGFDASYNLRPVLPNPAPHPLQADLLVLLDRARAALAATPPPLELPKLSPRDDEQYIVRCVYERPKCAEQPAIVSQRSQPFRLAPFFDLDAPARPIRIPLPGDISLAAMRKFKKNVSFMMSDAMRRKMDSLTGAEQAVLDGDPPNDERDTGLAFICSFSIQIIFIVAFMLLLIFVFVLNIFFQWMIFFRICLPIPKSLAPK